MKKIKTLFVQFENMIPQEAIPAFRGAIVEKVGRENTFFHQHKGDDTFHYQYPLIQYKRIANKASIFCLGEGADEIQKLFAFKQWDINLQGEKTVLNIHKLDLHTATLNVWEKPFSFSLYQWVALNQQNYTTYQQTESLAEKCALLEKIITANILSFAKGVGWTIEQPIKTTLNKIDAHKQVHYKGVPLLALDVQFSCNVFLPNYIGLGKSVSHGFGVLRMNKKIEK